MVIKQEISVLVGATKVITYDATADFTSEPIEWVDFSGFTLNVWFPVLNGGNPKPTLDIEVSNTTDLLSFTPLINQFNTELIDLALPSLWELSKINAKYIRFIYKTSGVNAGSTVTFNLNKLING